MPCVDQSQANEDGHDISPSGLVLPLASEIQNNCILFFPVTDEIGSLINHLLEAEETGTQQLHMIEVYKTMVNSWRSGERFLSGIYIDKVFDVESGEDAIHVNLMLSSINDGFIEAVIKVNFIHAIIVAVLEGVDIMISNELLAKLLPDALGEEEGDDNDNFDDQLDDSDYPVDEDILNIAKKIMGGKIK
jgi:hypothetical protein